MVQVDYAPSNDYPPQTGLFDGQIDIVGNCDGEPFSAGGDSGSLVLNAPEGEDRAAAALLFAGGPDQTGVDHTIASPIGNVLDDLSLEAGSTLTMVECTASNAGPNGCNHVLATDDIPRCRGGGGGGGGGGGRPSNPGGGPQVSIDPVGLAVARSVNENFSDDLLAVPGVIGHGVSADENGDPFILVYVSSGSRRPVGYDIPSELDGVPVRTLSMGAVRAR